MSIKIYKIKSWQIAGLLILTFIWILSAFNYENTDYNNYRMIYEYYIPQNSNAYYIDFGYKVLCRLAISCGLSFVMFRGIYISLALIILYKGVKYFAERGLSFVLCLYLVFPFALDVVQFRFLFAVSLMIYALRFLSLNNRRGNIKFILLIIIASTQHISAILYLCFLLVNINIKIIKKVIFVVFFMETGLIFVMLTGIGKIAAKYFSHFSNYIYFDTYTVRLFILYTIMAAGIAVAIDRSNKKVVLGDKQKILQMVSILSLMFVPLILISVDFSRVYRGVIVLLYCGLYGIGSGKSKKIYVNLWRLFAIVYCCMMFYIHLSPHHLSQWNNIVLKLFNSNYFFNMF